MKILASCSTCSRAHIVKTLTQKPVITPNLLFFRIEPFECPRRGFKTGYGVTYKYEVAILTGRYLSQTLKKYLYYKDLRTNKEYQFALETLFNKQQIEQIGQNLNLGNYMSVNSSEEEIWV